MVQSLGLTLYNLRPKPLQVVAILWPDRPEGRLVWLHAPSADTARGLIALALRLISEDGVQILLTSPADISARPGMIVQQPPVDQPAEVRAFMDHWHPEAVLIADGELRPALLYEAVSRNIPLALVDARKPYMLQEREGWFPGLMRTSLHAFRHVVALDEVAARSFRKAGAALSAVHVAGRMEEESAALPCLEAERAALARLLATRPVWLAAALPEAEEVAVITAHRAAQSLAHRLLLIIVPQDPARVPALVARLAEDEGWIVADRSAEQEPEPDVDVFVADSLAELGLWYRLAPITFLGGSLAAGGSLRNPMEAAALGSAILHGPRAGEHGAAFGRLKAARAARAVGGAADLSEAVADLLSPDRAARLAQAAWGVASEGAEVTERVVGMVRGMMGGGK
jgi:3-deoxy-D-manno-octulosonic-acid transferase